MADHKSAIKRHRQSLERALRNSHYRTTVRTYIKRARQAAADKSPDLEKVVKEAIAMVDRVGGRGVIPRNRASRFASKLSKLLPR